ncbi:PREDICTED: tumor necrosis factor ligand superfamily member 6-like [Cyprinodon variegatus]|uniref:CD40 ligand n=1 Tax=Cyprinodon variegatus TaxID=28743 RepID=A0A3Q2CPJ1_CYPVA|nr:PREDICTED: tumor necrosis factor ligand superfamily member 6-like [Cyprinodon variegatus]
MINTYQTSVALPQAPPPVPPRLGRSQPVLIPAPLPSPGQSKSLLRFLVCVVVLQLFLSVVGFFYLYYNERQISQATYSSPQGRVGAPPIGKQETTYRALASMVVKNSSTLYGDRSGYIEWDMQHSVFKNINYFHNSWLTILEPGIYFVYSKVTFSKGSSITPLVSLVKLRKSEEEEEKSVMIAYCSLNNDMKSGSNPHMCTATQQDMIELERGNQLSIWVEDRSLVDYDISAISFGMYKV